MFSVMRFVGVPPEMIDPIGYSINRIIPGTYRGPDIVENRFSFKISTADDWKTQESAIRDTVEHLADVIADASSRNIAVEIDVAVEPDDYRSRVNTRLLFDLFMINSLQHNKVSLYVTVYGLPTEVFGKS